MKKYFKWIFNLVLSLILGFLFTGGIDLDDIKFSRNIRKLKKERWFKELSDNGSYYEKIYQNQKVQEYLCQDNIVEKIKNNDQERNYFLSLIK